MSSVKATSSAKPRKPDKRHPVDMALDAGMRPMLIGHGFRRKTKRCYVRETDNSVQFVRIFAGNRRGYQGGAGFGACGCVLIKKLVALGEELQLGHLDPPSRYTDHDCHLTCELRDYHFFFNIISFRREIRKKHPILWIFQKPPRREERIPEILDFRRYYSRFEDKIDAPESIYLIEDYGKLRADVFEKYIIPWFDKCEDISFAARWIYDMGGKNYRSGNMLLAAASCLAGDLDMAKFEIRKMTKKAKTTRDQYYHESRRPSLSIFSLFHRNSKRFANKYADFAYGHFQGKAAGGRALADRFEIELD